MRKYLFQILAVSFLLGIFSSSIALAIDYTTKGSGSNVQGSSKNTSNCTMSDLQDIKRFDRKAKAKIKKFYEIEEMAAQTKSYKEVLKVKRAMQKILDFLESNEFKSMKLIYNRCGKEIPRIKREPPFWVPI